MNANPRDLRAALVIAATVAACIATGAQAEYRQQTSPEEAVRARNICANVMRIPQGFVPFDACVESLFQTLRGKSPSFAVPAGTSVEVARPQETSYSQSNPEERRRKEEYSCAQLGILPGSAGFGQCVTGLDAALRSMEHSD